MSPKDSNQQSWTQLVVGILLGAIVTGIIQFAINERSKSNQAEAARVENVRKYLQTKLEKRQLVYASILEKVELALRPNSKKYQRDAAANALRIELPFFQPRSPTQIALHQNSKQIAIILLESNPDNSFVVSQRERIINTLKQDFHDDILSIEREMGVGSRQAFDNKGHVDKKRA